MQNETILQIVGWVLGIVGTLIVFIGGLAAYIFKQHSDDNRSQFVQNREDHNRIHDRIDEIVKGE